MVGRGESEYSRVLKTRKLLQNRDAQSAQDSENAANWNVSGTYLERISNRGVHLFLTWRSFSERKKRRGVGARRIRTPDFLSEGMRRNAKLLVRLRGPSSKVSKKHNLLPIGWTRVSQQQPYGSTI